LDVPTQSPTEAYLLQCAEAMQLRYGRQIRIRITKPSHSSLYPNGAWFDDKIGQILEPAGIDLSSYPKRYVMANGDAIPFSCAEVIEKGMIKLGNYYLQFVWEKPYRVIRPEAGENMWQFSLGFLRITRMK
jgi:hypothetical protein